MKLNDALQAGLARGKKLFAGVRNNIERLSNAGDDGFLGEVDLTQPAELYVCPECTEPTVTKQRDNSFSCSNCMMTANEGDELMLASDEDRARWHAHENGDMRDEQDKYHRPNCGYFAGASCSCGGREKWLESPEYKEWIKNSVAPTEPVSMGYGWDGGTEPGKGAKGSKIPTKPSMKNAGRDKSIIDSELSKSQEKMSVLTRRIAEARAKVKDASKQSDPNDARDAESTLGDITMEWDSEQRVFDALKKERAALTNDSEYPHDILPNKKDGLNRGISKYGNKKGER